MPCTPSGLMIVAAVRPDTKLERSGYGQLMYARPRRDERLRERGPAREPDPVPVQRLLALQRSAGNAAVARALSSVPARTIARTEINWIENDISKLLHIMPWKHGWDELIDTQLPMLDEDMKPRSEDQGQYSKTEKETLKEDYAKVMVWLKRTLRHWTERKNLDENAPLKDAPNGERWEFKRTFPKEETRRQVTPLTITIKGFRPRDKQTKQLKDYFIIGDAWVDTDRHTFLKKHDWSAQGYVPKDMVGVVGEGK